MLDHCQYTNEQRFVSLFVHLSVSLSTTEMLASRKGNLFIENLLCSTDKVLVVERQLRSSHDLFFRYAVPV